MSTCAIYSDPERPEIILKWLKDETFFSICSRQHAAWGNLNPSTTLHMLFNSRNQSTKHDFPHSLDTLHSNIRAKWGDADSIIYRRTIFPLFMPFQSHSRIQTAMQMLKGNSPGSIKYRLGLITGRFGAEHPLKACSGCIEMDISRHGVAYWHLSHQFPGVLICPIHKIWLQESTLNRRWAGRFQLALPDQAALIPRPAKDLNSLTLMAVKQLADATLDLASLGTIKSFDPLHVRSLYRNAIADLGYASQQAAASFAQHSSQLQPFHPLTSLPTTEQKASTYIQQLMRPPRGHSHPLKHLVMITWLFGTVDAFVDAYDRLTKIQEQNLPDATQPLSKDQPKPKRTETKQPKQLRPKTLKPTIRAQILRLLSKGTSKNTICTKFHITISTVNKLLRAEPQIKDSWTAAKLKMNLLEHRKKWTALSNSSPNSSTSTIRAQDPKLYAWLYRNDKAWLTNKNSELPTGRTGNHSKINWTERDIELEKKVLNALAQTLSERPKNDNITYSIYTLVPSLFVCLQKANQYPRTRALLLSLKKQKLLS
ncbi:hypothetical protein IPC468_29170 [Pseudomonas aeruginosa]|jgi:hypothetical protein|nr:hypothetical protein IPC468_29170 [Pseudomonas aeruginosa]